jgi:radical SAM protein with 4Fe4S-binding SPASM domain
MVGLKTLTNAYVTQKQPLSLVHFITNRCNARCAHCFIDFDNPDTFKSELSTEEIVKLTEHVGDSLINVNITGGEPFLRKDIYEIVEAYFKNTSILTVFITSHGMFTDRIRAFLDKFLASGLDRKIIFSFSMDGIAEEHNEIRRIKGLYEKTLNTYRLIREYNSPKIVGKLGITVTDKNHDKVQDLYRHLRDEAGIKGVTATIMREQGVVKQIAPETKAKILESYSQLVDTIHQDMVAGRMEGYSKDFHGRMINAKNMIVNNIQKETYTDPHYVSLCPAGALFGVIGSKGEVYPCEILDKELGNLRDYDMDFLALWRNTKTQEVKKLIKDTRCNCSYECAWTINVISNKKYIPRLLYHVARQG